MKTIEQIKAQIDFYTNAIEGSQEGVRAARNFPPGSQDGFIQRHQRSIRDFQKRRDELLWVLAE